MLTLYHAPQSRSSRIVWLLEELGADYEIRYVAIPRPGAFDVPPDPDNPHPDKKVPALVHDGVLVTESAAIGLHLTDLHPEAGLGPPVGDPQRGSFLSWLFYYAGVIEAVVMIEFAQLGDHPMLARNFRGLAEMQARVLAALEANDYILGETFSTVDLLVAGLGQFSRPSLPPGARVDAYLERIAARPALARSLKKDAPPGA